MKNKLSRTKQCAKCPWKVSTDPHKIPDGYSVRRHEALKGTIAEPGSTKNMFGTMRAMACHESPVGEETWCLGWLMNQVGPGNNIGLRILMRGFDLAEVELDGEQHKRFEDTLPRGRRKG